VRQGCLSASAPSTIVRNLSIQTVARRCRCAVAEDHWSRRVQLDDRGDASRTGASTINPTTVQRRPRHVDRDCCALSVCAVSSTSAWPRFHTTLGCTPATSNVRGTRRRGTRRDGLLDHVAQLGVAQVAADHHALDAVSLDQCRRSSSPAEGRWAGRRRCVHEAESNVLATRSRRRSGSRGPRIRGRANEIVREEPGVRLTMRASTASIVKRIATRPSHTTLVVTLNCASTRPNPRSHSGAQRGNAVARAHPRTGGPDRAAGRRRRSSQ